MGCNVPPRTYCVTTRTGVFTPAFNELKYTLLIVNTHLKTLTNFHTIISAAIRIVNQLFLTNR